MKSTVIWRYLLLTRLKISYFSSVRVVCHGNFQSNEISNQNLRILLVKNKWKQKVTRIAECFVNTLQRNFWMPFSQPFITRFTTLRKATYLITFLLKTYTYYIYIPRKVNFAKMIINCHTQGFFHHIVPNYMSIEIFHNFMRWRR